MELRRNRQKRQLTGSLSSTHLQKRKPEGDGTKEPKLKKVSRIERNKTRKRGKDSRDKTRRLLGGIRTNTHPLAGNHSAENVCFCPADSG